MTPDTSKLLAAEAAAWKSRQGRACMKLLDRDLGDAGGGIALHLRIRSTGTFSMASKGDDWGVPDSLAVAFLKQQARAKLGIVSGTQPPVRIVAVSDNDWLAVRGRAMTDSGCLTYDERIPHPGAVHPTESHALISALLARRKKR